MRTLELLAPAKNLECGVAAIDHGADAVYIGAPRFGARAAVGNSVDDIRHLCDYAHQFGARVYVTVNTIVYNDELEDTYRLLEQLAEAKADAVLVQDMAVARYVREHPSLGLALHASTQTDNRTVQKVRWLTAQGFKRVVLARELTLDEIAAIHQEVPQTELEVFVHGALCVSYSGLCYASQYCFGRSANRGECAQFCRMKFDLTDADGRMVEHQRHLLSLKDMNQWAHLEELVKAGAASFKIEGRLKDLSYVKNVTAAYSQQLDSIIARHPSEYRRASRGHCEYTFKPDLIKSFNRGYTTYFLHGRQQDIASFDTPKAIGEYVGTVKDIRGNSVSVAGIARFSNGDGLCFLNQQRELEGFRVNRVEGNRLFLLKTPQTLRQGMRLYRNNDQEFDKMLSRTTAVRKIPVTMELTETSDGFRLSMDGVSIEMLMEHAVSKTPQRENIVRQLSKLGGTPYECAEVVLPDDFNYFIPSSQLTEMRRRVVEASLAAVRTNRQMECEASAVMPETPPSYARTFLYNIANDEARAYYKLQGVADAEDAFEVRKPSEPLLLMQCRHCLRFSLGFCVKHGGKKPAWREPLYLKLGDGRRFRLEFDCRQCQMNVYAEDC
ncbi:MAG: U32 family peptidase [Prevotella sp.]|nr:U32 family peptidase [Prevotella sp.]